MIIISHSGSFNNTENFFKRSVSREYLLALEKYGREGVAALASATPVDTGETANSWDYNVVTNCCTYSVRSWYAKWWLCPRT